MVSGAAQREHVNEYSSLPSADGSHRVTASFRSFSSESLSLQFTLPQDASQASLREFGVSAQELDALMQQCMATPGCNQQEFDRRTTRYYQEHAMRLDQAIGRPAQLFVDVPQVVRRNRERVKPVATALRRLAAERGRDEEWMFNAAIALVQSGMVYRRPGAQESGRRILGFYPPPLALQRGYGDCDTKSALLAAILQNLSKTPLIGVHVPRHYLLGVAGTPRAGQAHLDYKGRSYVLVEAAGPSQRRPGEVAQATQAALTTKRELRVDPMF